MKDLEKDLFEVITKEIKSKLISIAQDIVDEEVENFRTRLEKQANESIFKIINDFHISLSSSFDNDITLNVVIKK